MCLLVLQYLSLCRLLFHQDAAHRRRRVRCESTVLLAETDVQHHSSLGLLRKPRQLHVGQRHALAGDLRYRAQDYYNYNYNYNYSPGKRTWHGVRTMEPCRIGCAQRLRVAFAARFHPGRRITLVWGC